MQVTNFERITVNPNQMGGVPCIRGLRIPVATVLRMLAGGMTEKEILAPTIRTSRAMTSYSASGSRRSPRWNATYLSRVWREIPCR